MARTVSLNCPDTPETGRERHFTHTQIHRLENNRAVWPAGPSPARGAGPDLGDHEALQLAGAVAEPPGQSGHPLPVDDAIVDRAIARATTSPRRFHSGEPGDVSGRHRLQALNPAR